MYDDGERRFNLTGASIKIVIFVVLIVLAILILVLTVRKEKNKSNFEDNLNKFKDASYNYFEENKFFESEENKKITLDDLIEANKIDVLKNSNGEKCDGVQSYSEITKKDNSYEIVFRLICGDENKVVKNTIDIADETEEPDIPEEPEDPEEPETPETPEEPEEPENPGGSSGGSTGGSGGSSSGGSSGGTTTPTKKLYYEYVKVNKSYSKWQLKAISGSSVEKKTDYFMTSNYCKTINTSYYFVAAIPTNYSSTYVFTAKATDVPSSTKNFGISAPSGFGSSINNYTYHLTKKNLQMINGTAASQVVSNVYDLKNASLISGDYACIANNPKLSGSNYVLTLRCTISKRSSVKPYYTSSGKGYYFVPVYLKGTYVDNNSCIKDLNENASNYSSYKIYDTKSEYVTAYRSYTLVRDYSNIKWSTATSMDGYERTGNSEYR